MNGWTLDMLPRNRCEEDRGEEIKKAVMQKLRDECRIMNWRTLDPQFAKKIVVCCPRLSATANYKKGPLAGTWVVRGIQEFLQGIVDGRKAGAEGYLTQARRITGYTEQALGPLSAAIDTALSGRPHSNTAKKLEHARDLVDQAMLLNGEAMKLQDQLSFHIEDRAHGFMVHRGKDKAARVEWIQDMYSVQVSSDPKVDIPRSHLRDYRPYEPPSNQSYTLGWAFASQSDKDMWIEGTLAERDLHDKLSKEYIDGLDGELDNLEVISKSLSKISEKDDASFRSPWGSETDVPGIVRSVMNGRLEEPASTGSQPPIHRPFQIAELPGDSEDDATQYKSEGRRTSTIGAQLAALQRLSQHGLLPSGPDMEELQQAVDKVLQNSRSASI
jgi:hypothetical protein